ncbi:NAD(P)H-quinone oxidoreductase [Nocardioides zeae]|uniref:NADPH2:quinone reductase n=1 Tax=Nocardioides zeae TaxID=1457234 RepID=A0AAJ1X1T4_9ACTN|nr:NAD(P)H-quinone oxidoreductase [Nocardioides zeae]MDQ1103779.1 NADPH2:quinone reductase [Nocardioides zeae]
MTADVRRGSVATTMRVVRVPAGGTDAPLRCEPASVPVPGHGQVLVRTAAIGVNRADVMQRAGTYPLPPGSTDVPGLEASGTVVATGPGIDAPAVGAQVCALLPGGGYAEVVAVRADHTLPVPDGVGLEDAAGLVEVAATVWSNLLTARTAAGLVPDVPPTGSWVLVHGGSGGVGSMAVQLAAALGMRVVTTVGSAVKADFALALGAELVVDHTREDFREVLAAHGIRPVRILDVVGAAYLARNLDVLARGGRLAVVAHQSGPVVDLDLRTLLRGDVTVEGSGLRARSEGEKARILAQLREHVWPLLEQRLVRPVTHARIALDDADRALDLVARGQHLGKVLLVP